MDIKELTYNLKIRSRLDEFLTNQKFIHSRSFASKLIRRGNVKINAIVTTKTSMRLSDGDKIEVSIENLHSNTNIKPENIPLDIVFENENILIINKPAGLVVHPGAGNYEGTLVSGLINFWGKLPDGLDSVRPGIVHRLDKDTSGLLLVAKNDKSVSYYSGLFKNRKIEKKYITLLYGRFPEREGSFSANMARHRIDRKKMTIVNDDKGRFSKTEYKVQGYYRDPINPLNEYSLMQVLLKTGRTHQIRVHFKYLGYPIVGDKTYAGRKQRNIYRLANRHLLHAYSLKFINMQGDLQQFKIPLPKDFQQYLNLLEKI